MVVFRLKWLYWCKSGCIRAKVVVFETVGYIWAKVVVFGQKWFYSSKSGCIRAKGFCSYLGRSGLVGQKVFFF